MTQLQEKDIQTLWNDNMKRATSCAREMFDATKDSSWLLTANKIDETRRLGNVMMQQKSMSEADINQSLFDWKVALGQKTDKEVANKNKRKLIIDG